MKSRRFYSHGILLIVMLALTACSTTAPTRTTRAPRDDELPVGDQGAKRKVGTPYKVAGKWYYPKEDPAYDQVGYASWYGQDFHGKLTANGEVYNMNALTAAHKTLPMPTFVKVTNLENNRSIVLRVNDRGPFVGDRLIDVSRRAAQLLGFQQQGITRVRVQASDERGRVIEPSSLPRTQTAETAPPQAPDVGGGPVVAEQHFIQVGSYSSRDNAEVQANRLRSSGHNARIMRQEQGGSAFWRVRVGPFGDRRLAEERLDRIVADGFYEARIFTEK